MTHKQLLKLLTTEGLEFVVVGGTAMRLYNSPRVTHDIDIAVRTLDIDRLLELMYRAGYSLITGVSDTSLTICPSLPQADAWISRTKPGSISLVQCDHQGDTAVPMERVDIASQVDFLFELCIPVIQLRRNARTIQLQDISFPVASIEDLIRLKQARSDRSPADDDDIRFLRSLLK